MKNIFYFFVFAVYFATPFESVAIVKGFSVVKLVTAILLVITLLYYRTIPIPKTPFIKLFLLFTIYIILSVTWSINQEKTLQHSLANILPTFIVTSIIFYAIRSMDHIITIFKTYAFASLIAASWALFLIISGFDFTEHIGSERVTVLGQDQNELSFLLSFGIVSVLFILKLTRKNNVKYLFSLISISLLSYIILSTGSRTGFIILISIFSIYFLNSLKSKKKLLLVPVFLIIGIYFFNNLPEKISSRLFETSNQLAEQNLTGRGEIWAMGLAAFNEKDSFLLGTGFKTFSSLMDEAYNWPVAPHNTYLSMFIEIGLIGFIFYISIVFFLIRETYILYKNESILYFILIVPLLLTMFSLSTATRRWLPLIGIIIIKLKELSLKRMT